MDTSKNGFGFSRQEADHVMKEIQNMDVKTASEFLESQYGYYNAIYAYEDLEIHKGTAEEINHYIEQKLSEHSFSWYFAKKSSRILQDCIWPFCNSLAIIFIYF